VESNQNVKRINCITVTQSDSAIYKSMTTKIKKKLNHCGIVAKLSTVVILRFSILVERQSAASTVNKVVPGQGGWPVSTMMYVTACRQKLSHCNAQMPFMHFEHVTSTQQRNQTDSITRLASFDPQLCTVQICEG